MGRSLRDFASRIRNCAMYTFGQSLKAAWTHLGETAGTLKIVSLIFPPITTFDIVQKKNCMKNVMYSVGWILAGEGYWEWECHKASSHNEDWSLRLLWSYLTPSWLSDFNKKDILLIEKWLSGEWLLSCSHSSFPIGYWHQCYIHTCCKGKEQFLPAVACLGWLAPKGLACCFCTVSWLNNTNNNRTWRKAPIPH